MEMYLEHNSNKTETQYSAHNILHNNGAPLRLNYKNKDKGAAYKYLANQSKFNH